jgi:hypothetical protein
MRTSLTAGGNDNCADVIEERYADVCGEGGRSAFEHSISGGACSRVVESKVVRVSVQTCPITSKRS